MRLTRTRLQEEALVQNLPHERFLSGQMGSLENAAAAAKGLRRAQADVWAQPQLPAAAENELQKRPNPNASQQPSMPEPGIGMGEFMSALTRNSSGASVQHARANANANANASAANSNASLLSFIDMENLFLPSTLDSSRLAEDLFADPNLLQGFAQVSGSAANTSALAAGASSSESLAPNAPAVGSLGIGIGPGVGVPIDNELRDQLARVAREELIDLTESDFTVTTPPSCASVSLPTTAPPPTATATYSAAAPSLATPPSTPISMQTSQAIIDGLSVATLLVDPKGTSSILDDIIKGAVYSTVFTFPFMNLLEVSYFVAAFIKSFVEFQSNCCCTVLFTIQFLCATRFRAEHPDVFGANGARHGRACSAARTRIHSARVPAFGPARLSRITCRASRHERTSRDFERRVRARLHDRRPIPDHSAAARELSIGACLRPLEVRRRDGCVFSRRSEGEAGAAANRSADGRARASAGASQCRLGAGQSMASSRSVRPVRGARAHAAAATAAASR